MKGHIFNLLEEFLIESAGMDGYETILSNCSFDTTEGFIRTANYPDEKLNELTESAISYLGISMTDAHLAFGRWLLPHLAKLIPKSMMDHQHPARFLETVDYIHRVELKKLYPDAEPPMFKYEVTGPHEGILNYNSSRAMYDLVEGVLLGVADYFGSEMAIERFKVEGSQSECDFVIKYSK